MFWALVFLASFFFLYTLGLIREQRFARRVNAWEHDRINNIAPVFQAAFIVQSVPDHTNVKVGADGNVLMAGASLGEPATMLNFDALKKMLGLMLEMEQARREAVKELKNALKAVELWEKANPQPKPPTIFGWRFPLPV